MVTTAPKSESFDPATLQRLLDGRYRELREQIKDTMCRADFEPPIALPTPEYRELVSASRISSSPPRSRCAACGRRPSRIFRGSTNRGKWA